MSNISSFCDWNRNLASDWTQHNILAASAHCIKIPISGNFLYIPPHQNPLWSVPPIPTKHAEKLIWTLMVQGEHSAREGSPLVKKRVHVNSGVLSLPIGDVQSAHILLRRGSHLNAERSDAAFLFPALSHTYIRASFCDEASGFASARRRCMLSSFLQRLHCGVCSAPVAAPAVAEPGFGP